ncbi:MAG: RNA-binding protein [Actinobacteria bacterium]|nr:RNA-binding protein [Actinomycetota bacterium]
MSKRLFVGNLEYSATNEELEELFSNEGSVASAKIIRTLDGKSKGFGFVEMETEDDAIKAMEKLDKSNFKDRVIQVNEAKPQVNRSSNEHRGRRNFNKESGGDLNSKLRRLRKRY